MFWSPPRSWRRPRGGGGGGGSVASGAGSFVSAVSSYGGGGGGSPAIPTSVPASNYVNPASRTGVRAPTPQASQQGTRAKALRERYIKALVPAGVPDEYKKAVAKYGPMLNDVAKAEGISGKAPGTQYLAKVLQFESGWQPNVVNASSGATGLGQFIPSTRADFASRLGVDPYKGPGKNIKASAMHLSGDYGYGAGYRGYNPGYSNPDAPEAENVGPLTKIKIPKGGGPIKGGGTSQVPSLVQIGKKAQRKFGVEAREQPHFDPVDPVHTAGSMHYSGDAIDFQGDPQQLSRTNKWLARKYGSETDEMFYDPGINIADGQPTSPIGGHPTHVHFGLDDPGDTATSVFGGATGSTGFAGGAALPGGAAPGSTSTQRPRTPTRRSGGGSGLSALAQALLAKPTRPGQGRAEEDEIAAEDDDLVAALSGASFRPRRRLRTR